jgi:hypothetical protein
MTYYADSAAVQVHNLLGDEQAQTGRGLAGQAFPSGLAEFVEEMRLQFKGNAHTRILHGEARLASVFSQAHAHGTASWGELERIEEQVIHDSSKLIGVEVHRHHLRGTSKCRANPLA